MSRAARFFWVCAVCAALCFVALAVISKTTLEPVDMVIFDSRILGYSSAAARAYLDWIAQTPEALASYLGIFRQLDTAFPLLLSLALGGGIWLNAAGAHPARRVIMLGAPAAYLMMDLMENARVAEMLRSGVAVEDQAIAQASSFTTMKWALLAVSLLVLISAWFSARNRTGR